MENYKERYEYLKEVFIKRENEDVCIDELFDILDFILKDDEDYTIEQLIKCIEDRFPVYEISNDALSKNYLKVIFPDNSKRYVKVDKKEIIFLESFEKGNPYKIGFTTVEEEKEIKIKQAHENEIQQVISLLSKLSGEEIHYIFQRVFENIDNSQIAKEITNNE